MIFECESDANDLVSPQKSHERPIINLSISVVAVYVTYQNRMVPARSSGLCAFLAMVPSGGIHSASYHDVSEFEFPR